MSFYKINHEQRLYVLNAGKNGYSCLGFDVLDNRARALAAELDRLDLIPQEKGTATAYYQYVQLVDLARERYEYTGQKSTTGLTPQLIGLEGKRVEVVDQYDQRRRFYVGKSTGFIPAHLEIKTARSMGGMAVMGAPFKSVCVIR